MSRSGPNAADVFPSATGTPAGESGDLAGGWEPRVVDLNPILSYRRLRDFVPRVPDEVDERPPAPWRRSSSGPTTVRRSGRGRRVIFSTVPPR